LDESKLIDYGNKIVILDDNGNEISNTSITGKRKSVALEDLNEHTINAFIAAEDGRFYKHNGLNYKRMLKALITNIKAGAFKEGASTISQQLLKNTHLSNDKTIKRKLCEIKLTKQLEKKYSKNEILEMYLNTIYFGHSCYGIQSAANFYFNKRAEDLTLSESATLVGLLSSPNNYSPFKNQEKSLYRRNLALKSMKNAKFIDENTYLSEINKPLEAKKTNDFEYYSSYISKVFDELENIGIDAYKLNDGCKIKTYLNADLQREIEQINYEYDNAVIVTSNETCGVCAYKSTIGDARRQPGSCIKPLLVYAPAINEKLIDTFTVIDDKKLDFNGYCPENYNKKYYGEVTVEECLKKSLNVPAVKILNQLSLEKAENYAKKMGINLESEEKNLSLALGGMKYGLNIKEICDAYSVFTANGSYKNSAFIDEIIDKEGKTIYKHKILENKVFDEGTTSLVNEMLINTAKNGTAKKLKNFNFDIAAKTGTCGNENGNTDAYTISYTGDHILGVWLGDANNKKLNITGGKEACEITKIILNKLYSDYLPKKIETDIGTKIIEIDKNEYKNNKKIALADDIAPLTCKKKVKVLINNIPKQKLTNFSHPIIKIPTILVENNTVCIVLCYAEYYYYLINREHNDEKIVIYDGKYIEKIYDSLTNDGTYSYSITPYFINKNEKIFGKTLTLSPVFIANNLKNPQKNLPDIVHDEWYFD